MKKTATTLALAFVLATPASQAQLLKKLEQGLMGGQQNGTGQGMPGQNMTGLSGALQSLQGTQGVGQSGQGGMLQQITGMLGGQNQSTLIGNVSLPPAQYMVTNVQTGQAFYVTVQNSQMYLLNQPGPQGMGQGAGFVPVQTLPSGIQSLIPGQNQNLNQNLAPGQTQQGGVKGIIQNGLGNFLRNELSGQQQQQIVPNQ